MKAEEVALTQAALLIRGVDPSYNSDNDILDVIPDNNPSAAADSDSDKPKKQPMKQGGRGKNKKAQKTESGMKLLKKGLAKTPDTLTLPIVTFTFP